MFTFFKLLYLRAVIPEYLLTVEWMVLKAALCVDCVLRKTQSVKRATWNRMRFVEDWLCAYFRRDKIYSRAHTTDWVKNTKTLYSCLQLHQMLTDFQNSFTVTLCSKLAIVIFKINIPLIICNNIKSIALIVTEFCPLTKITKYSSWLAQTYYNSPRWWISTF